MKIAIMILLYGMLGGLLAVFGINPFNLPWAFFVIIAIVAAIEQVSKMNF